MPVSRERFDSGMTYEQWVDSMTQNKERFLKIYETAQISAKDIAAFKALPAPINVLVLGEDWCGDVIANLPILAKLAHAVGGKLNLRIFKRDSNLDLMDQYLYQGKFRSIPTVVFFDDKMNEIGGWWERPQMARNEMDEARRRFAAEHADLPDVNKPAPEMSDATRQLYMATFAKLRADNAARWTQAVVDEVRQAMKV
jgi:hypothetical protein